MIFLFHSLCVSLSPCPLSPLAQWCMQTPWSAVIPASPAEAHTERENEGMRRGGGGGERGIRDLLSSVQESGAGGKIDDTLRKKQKMGAR